MANLIDITPNILSQNTICFDTRNMNAEQIPVPIQNAKFGILNFKAVTARETTEEMDFLFVVDCSGSMSDACSDGRSKMQHIIHTLKNMILFFHEHPNSNINVTIHAFDTQLYPIVSRTKITNENVDEIVNKVDKITPRGSTNIEYALRKSSEEIKQLTTEFPNNRVNYIFMTDGEATDGSKNIQVLQSIVNPNITNAFIGFGIEHDAALLNGISAVGKSAYYFIDKLENAGLVYGEILHGIIYKLLTDTEIIIENGLVYDFKTNTWVESLKIGDIVSEANKTYNIISTSPSECKVNLQGTMDNLVILFPSTHIENTDLTIQMYRQRTLQLLYEVNAFCNRRNDNPNAFNRNRIQLESLSFEGEKMALKLKLTIFLEELKKFMTDNNMEDNAMLKNLCDDVYICFRTFGTRFGTMYCSARQTSQGTHRQYAVSSLNVRYDMYDNNNVTIRSRRRPPSIYSLEGRTNMIDYTDLPDDIELPTINHTISGFADTPYQTPQATQLMREISRPIEYKEDSEEDDDLSILTQEIN